MRSTALDRAGETGFGREKLCLIETKQLKIHEGDSLSIFLRRDSSFTQPAHGKPARKSQFSAQVKALLKRSKVFFPKAPLYSCSRRAGRCAGTGVSEPAVSQPL